MSYKTKQRELILEFLRQNSDSHLTAQSISEALSVYKVGKSTVYRYLDKLCEEGLVRKYILSDGSSACYQYTNGEDCSRHFHLKCLKCNALVHLECDYLKETEQHINAHHGFSVDTSRTVFYGLCADCKEKEKKNV